MAAQCAHACVAEYLTLWNNKDVKGMIDKYYRDSSKVVLPNGSLVVGKADILKYMQAEFAKKAYKATWTIEDVFGSGDFATTQGPYTMTDEKGVAVKCGRSVTVWKKGPDGCRIEIDAFTECSNCPKCS